MSFLRFDCHDLDRRVLLLEEPAHAGDGPAGAEPGEEVADPPLGLLPDLRAGRLVVGPDVVGVLVLVGHGIAAALLGGRQRAGQGDGSVLGVVHRTEIVGGLPHLGAQHPQHHLLLLRHSVGDGDRQPGPLQQGESGEGDGGVPRRGFHQFAPGQLTPRPHPGQQVGGGPVLDGAVRIEPLELQVQL